MVAFIRSFPTSSGPMQRILIFLTWISCLCFLNCVRFGGNLLLKDEAVPLPVDLSHGS